MTTGETLVGSYGLCGHGGGCRAKISTRCSSVTIRDAGPASVRVVIGARGVLRK